MSLELLEKNFIQAKTALDRYNELIQEKREIEKKVSNLKLSYEKGMHGREVFSEHNNKLMEIDKEIEKIKSNLKVISGNMRKEVEDEIKNVKYW